MLLPKLYVMFAFGVISPATTKPASVPVLVILGCDAVVNVPVNKLADTLPFDTTKIDQINKNKVEALWQSRLEKL